MQIVARNPSACGTKAEVTKSHGLIWLQVGSEVARRARGLGMQIIAHDPFASEAKAAAIGVRLVSLNEALAQGDFFSLHTPLTPQTKVCVKTQCCIPALEILLMYLLCCVLKPLNTFCTCCREDMHPDQDMHALAASRHFLSDTAHESQKKQPRKGCLL